MTKQSSLTEHYERQLKPLIRSAPFVVRITEWKGQPIPVVVVKERINREEAIKTAGDAGLQERGHIKGEALRRLLPLLKKVCAHVTDSAGVPTQVERYFTQEGLRQRVSLPIDDESGAKLALIFRLQERIPDIDRAELIAYRVLMFSREEALYWFSRITDFGPDANRWAISGLRLMLGGQPGDAGVGRMLEKLRTV